jgi:hypothetical protein
VESKGFVDEWKKKHLSMWICGVGGICERVRKIWICWVVGISEWIKKN